MADSLISKVTKAPLSSSEIDILRDVVYTGYDALLSGKKQEVTLEDYPRFHIIHDQIYWSGTILDDEIEGLNFFLGKIKEREQIKVKEVPINIFYAVAEDDDFEGIDLFENYANKIIRQTWLHKSNLVVLASSKADVVRNSALTEHIAKCLNFYANMMRLKSV